MTDNTFNLDELQELKQAYQLIDQKLDGKEIVTPEQIRKVTLKNISIFKTMFKFSTSWSLFAFTPILIFIFAFSPKMTASGMWILGIYLAVELALHFLLIRKMNREDHSELDLRTLLSQESLYTKSAFALSCAGFAFWIVFNYFYMGIGASIAMLVIFILAIGSRTRFFTKKVSVRELTMPVEPKEPGKFRKAISWFFLSILIIVTLILGAGLIYNTVGGTINPMEFLTSAGCVIIYLAFAVNFLFLERYKKGLADKMYRVISIAVVVGIVIAAIPIVHTAVITHAIENGSLSPLLIGVLALFINGTIKRTRNK